ncbi:hypothetical protein SAMN04489733_1435 [Amycolatopsis keratiniphila]|nr:hypothetical protein SAMN04489733_1435 [Amycolatopsis keratiniphila]
MQNPDIHRFARISSYKCGVLNPELACLETELA